MIALASQPQAHREPTLILRETVRDCFPHPVILSPPGWLDDEWTIPNMVGRRFEVALWAIWQPATETRTEGLAAVFLELEAAMRWLESSPPGSLLIYAEAETTREFHIIAEQPA